MDSEDFETWKVCWRTNLLFHRPADSSQQCIQCSQINTYPNGTRRSVFWLEATRCSAGHRQATTTELQKVPAPGICAVCDHNYVFDVLKGKHTCRREDCRRFVRINETAVRERMPDDRELLTQFLSCAKKCSIYECTIHCEEVEYEGSPTTAFKAPTSECDHDRNVCNACVKRTFEAAIRGGRLKDLKCPDPECMKPVNLDTIRANTSVDSFKLYNKKLAQETMAKDERFRWCSCGHGQIHDDGESYAEWICAACNKRHCFICRDSDTTCHHLREIDAQRETTKAEDKEAARQALKQAAFRKRENVEETQRVMARISKKCPSASCNIPIERESGCAHFTCKNCRTEFCWACKVIWKSGRALHLDGCQLGTNTTISKANLDQTGYAIGWDRDAGYDRNLDKGLFLMTGHR